MKVRTQAYLGDNWVNVGFLLHAGIPPASMSSNHPTRGRQIYTIGWLDGDGPGVWRSDGGIDIEEGVGREVIAESFTKLADLREGPHKRILYTKNGPITFRFRVVD